MFDNLTKYSLEHQQIETLVYYTSTRNYHPSLIQYLVPSDQHKTQRINSTKRQQVFILGRALLSQALKQHAGSEVYDLAYLPHGKPILTQPIDWQFNLSHSGKHVILALQQKQAVGIDCEQTKPRSYYRIAQQIFSSSELLAIKNAKNPMTYFYTLWTQHEAYVKYAGESIFSTLPKKSTLSLQSFQYHDCIFSLCRQHSDTPLSIKYYHYHLLNQTISTINPHIITAEPH